MTKDNLAYYERRAREEARAAESATSAQAASAHRLLAIEYQAQADELRLHLGSLVEVGDVGAANGVDRGASTSSKPKLSVR